MNTDCNSEQKALDFDAFLKLHGYSASTPDCSNIQNEKDCLARGEQEPGCCESCRKFAEIQDHWENICEVNRNRVENGTQIVESYTKAKGYGYEEDDSTTLTDLLADLRHWAAKNRDCIVYKVFRPKSPSDSLNPPTL